MEKSATNKPRRTRAETKAIRDRLQVGACILNILGSFGRVLQRVSDEEGVRLHMLWASEGGPRESSANLIHLTTSIAEFVTPAQFEDALRESKRAAVEAAAKSKAAAALAKPAKSARPSMEARVAQLEADVAALLEARTAPNALRVVKS